MTDHYPAQSPQNNCACGLVADHSRPWDSIPFQLITGYRSLADSLIFSNECLVFLIQDTVNSLLNAMLQDINNLSFVPFASPVTCTTISQRRHAIDSVVDQLSANKEVLFFAFQTDSAASHLCAWKIPLRRISWGLEPTKRAIIFIAIWRRSTMVLTKSLEISRPSFLELLPDHWSGLLSCSCKYSLILFSLIYLLVIQPPFSIYLCLCQNVQQRRCSSLSYLLKYH